MVDDPPVPKPKPEHIINPKPERIILAPDEHDRAQQRWDRIRQRFAERARRSRPRRWFSFAEIADHCAKPPGRVGRDENDRRGAYQDLTSAFLAGEFEDGDRNGRTKVLYLYPEIGSIEEQLQPELPLATATASEQYRRFGIDDFIEEVLDYCWLPRDVCRDWFAGREIKPPSHWFQAAAVIANIPTLTGPSAAVVEAAEATAKKRKKTGKPPVKLEAAKKAMRQYISLGMGGKDDKRTRAELIQDLSDIKVDDLPNRFPGFKRTTLGKARAAIIAEADGDPDALLL
jgi:hypothetical protein